MTSLWWYIARSSGLVAWALLALSVLWGLALSTRALGARPRPTGCSTSTGSSAASPSCSSASTSSGWRSTRGCRSASTQMLVPFSSTGTPSPWPGGSSASTCSPPSRSPPLLRRRMPEAVVEGRPPVELRPVRRRHHPPPDRRHRPPQPDRCCGRSIGATSAIVFFTVYRIVGPGKAVSAKAGRPDRPPVAGEPQVIDPARPPRAGRGLTDRPLTVRQKWPARPGASIRPRPSSERPGEAHTVERLAIDLLAPELYGGDPYPTYAWMRANEPVYWDEVNELWGIARYDDIVRIEKDKDELHQLRHHQGRLPAQPPGRPGHHRARRPVPTASAATWCRAASPRAPPRPGRTTSGPR